MDLKEYIDSIQITMYRFALNIGVSPATIYNIVQKGLRPNRENARNIEVHTAGNVTVQELRVLKKHVL